MLFTACRSTPNSVTSAKEVLIKDTGKTVANESDADNLVRDNLDFINAVDLLRVSGPINNNTLINTVVTKQEDNRFQVNIEYFYERAQASGQTAKMTVTVTGDGKIYGEVRLQPD